MPQTDSWISFAFSHQTLIIEGIFATILGIVVIWLFANLQEENENSKVSNKDIEGTLKRILAQTQNNLPPAPTAAPSGASASSAAGAKPGGAPAGAAPVAAGGAALIAPGSATVTQAASVAGAGAKIIVTPGTTSAATPTSASPSTPAATTAPATTAATTPPTVAAVAAPTPTATPSAAAPAAAAATIVTPPMPQGAPAGDSSSAGSSGDVARLKSDLEMRNRKVDELEKVLNQAREDLKKYQENAVNNTALDDFRKKIETLEGRLREYAIIEDDIANLSAYKDENVKLKDELALLRRKGGGRVEDPAPTPAPSAPTQINPNPASVSNAQGAKTPDGPSWPINDSDTKSLIKEFDNLMGTQTPATEILDQANAKEGEKLIADFQNFMKGTEA